MSERLVITSEPLFQEKAIVPALPDHLLPVIFFFFQKGKNKAPSKFTEGSAQFHNCGLLDDYYLLDWGAI